MEEPLSIEIYSPEENLFCGTARAIFLPGRVGPFEVLHRHAPIITELVQGEIRILSGDGQPTSIFVKGGFARVKNDKVSVCVEK